MCGEREEAPHLMCVRRGDGRSAAKLAVDTDSVCAEVVEPLTASRESVDRMMRERKLASDRHAGGCAEGCAVAVWERWEMLDAGVQISGSHSSDAMMTTRNVPRGDIMAET